MLVPDKPLVNKASFICAEESSWIPYVANQVKQYLTPEILNFQDGLVARIVAKMLSGDLWESHPILADALEEAGYSQQEDLNHLRGTSHIKIHKGYAQLHFCYMVQAIRDLTERDPTPKYKPQAHPESSMDDGEKYDVISPKTSDPEDEGISP